MTKMIHRYASKPFIALFMSFVLLFSSLGVLAGPSSQAIASTTGPGSIREWLPAPGQFVNEAGWGATGDVNSKWTNTPGSTGVSLGSFGGSIVYKFDEPIQNSPKNPYGVDFTVFGNAFAGNEEPAGVAVAQDDGTGNPGPWFYIAGSEHYEDSTIWDYRVTYTNPEPAFTSPNGVNVPWVDNQSGSGNVKTNGSHKHAYYPIPANYPNAPSDFNNQSYTYSGVKINVRKNAFGYPDTHANGSAPYDVPANPYLTSPVKGDPIDISWAVDSAGKPVNLTNISFVKVYNAVQIDGGVFGEIGAEVTSLQKVTVNNAVYETADLSSIVLSGVGTDITKPVTVTSGVYVYEDIRINADKIKITANGTASQIFVNNKSGTSNTLIDKEITLSPNKAKIVRVIAQEGINTPKIYYLSVIKEANKAALNASIADVESMTKGNYSDTSWQALQNSLAAAKEESANTSVIQDQVDVTLANLLAAVQGLQNNAPPTITVSVIVNGFSATAGKIVNLDKTDTVVDEGTTAASAIKKVLDEKQLSFVNVSGNYITRIGDLDVADGGSKSGWMYLVNGQFADVGIADYKLKSSDIISLVYTDDYEQDITTTANKTALNAKITDLDTLQQGNYTDASWLVLQNSLTLAKAVIANTNAIQYHADSALAKINAAFQNLVTTTIPPVDPQTIAVSFTLNGISAAAGKSVTLPKTIVNIEPGHTAAYVIEKVLNEAGISYVNENGAYISTVGGLSAFDGGPNSGWLYSVDGVDPDVGIASYILDHNADIVLRYTDNYLDENPPTNPGDPNAPSGGQPSAGDIQAAIDAASAYFLSKSSGVSSDWSAIGLARTGHKLPETYYQKLVNNVSSSKGDFSLVTDVERTILGITVAGGDASQVAGYNLIEKLYHHSKMTTQGINGLVFALLALDSKNYSVPDNAVWTRQKIINQIISRQNQDGGFTLSSGASDPDMTAMTFTALAPYVDNQALVQADTLAKAANWLSLHQQSNGGYLSYGVDNSESVSQAIIALTSNKIDPTSAKYAKNGVNLLDKLLKFRLPDGSFSHSTQLRSNGMATEQALQALAAFQIFKEGHGERLYDFTKPLPGLEPVTASPVKIRIEGPEGRIAEGSASAVTPFKALEAFTASKGIEMSGGAFDLAIQGIHSSYYGDEDYGFWDFAVHRGNEWITSYNGSSDQIILKPSDDIVFFYNNYSTVPIDSISFEPQASSIYEDVNFAVSVQKTEVDYSDFKLHPVEAEDVKVSIYNSQGLEVSSKTTNQEGKAFFTSLQAGNYTVSVSDYVEKSAPTVVHTTALIQVQKGTTPIQVPLPSGDQPKVVIPSDNQNYLIPITSADANKSITLEIPKESKSKIRLDVPTGTSLPKIEAVKGDLSVVIPKGAQITSGLSSPLELITTNDTTDSALKSALNTVISSGKKLDTVYHAITLGGNDRIEFDQFVTLVLAGLNGKEAAYIQNGLTKSIQRFSSDAEGLASGKNEYAYDSGNNLIIKTKHFTDFVAFATSNVITGPGNGNGGTTPPAKSVKISVDKLTINKGYVVSETSVELKTGDTVWSVLKRVLDTSRISYRATMYASYGSIYVQSIGGDGEFDHGPGSGWMYNVNGTYPGVGASKVIPEDGDSIQWRYTTNLGEDLGQDNSQWPKPVIPAEPTTVGSKTVFDIPADLNQDYTVKISTDLKSKDLITINIPDVKAKVLLNLEEVQDSIPAITASKGDITLSIDKGTVLKSGDHNVELLTSMNRDDTSILNLINNSLSSGSTKLTKLNQAFAMGNANQSVLFDKPLTFVIKNGKDQLAGYIEGNTFTPIERYESDEKGLEATKGKEKITYAYVKDNDLIIKTNHFTSFLSYTVGAKVTEPTPVFDWKKLYTDSNSVSPWAIDAISEASQKKFIEGNGGKFSPQATITRAEFTKILVNVLGLEIKKENAIHFQDVSQNDWYYPYVNTAYQADMISGYDAEHFYPNEKLTREQMAVIIANALTLPKAEQITGIEDMDQVSDWAKSSVQTIIASELMTGWNNRFHPVDEVTREMAIVVAMRAYKKR